MIVYPPTTCPQCGDSLRGRVQTWRDDWGIDEWYAKCYCGWTQHWAQGSFVMDDDETETVEVDDE